LALGILRYHEINDSERALKGRPGAADPSEGAAGDAGNVSRIVGELRCTETQTLTTLRAAPSTASTHGRQLSAEKNLIRAQTGTPDR
jgi:hypothetical protein